MKANLSEAGEPFYWRGGAAGGAISAFLDSVVTLECPLRAFFE